MGVQVDGLNPLHPPSPAQRFSPQMYCSMCWNCPPLSASISHTCAFHPPAHLPAGALVAQISIRNK
eukprot:6466200-Amphidinium_carterae.1